MKQLHGAAEEARLAALHDYQILDTPSESDFDDLVKLAAEICETPISLVSLVDRERQWFKGRYGLSVPETPRELSFCSHAIETPSELMEVRDASVDPRFATNGLVTGPPGIRFYASVPFVTPEGHALGTLCVIDRKPRQLTAKQREALRTLSRQVFVQMELRYRVAQLARHSANLAKANAELEGFYHAISHDMRAPLRAIRSFAGILAQDNGDQLDSTGMQLLEKIGDGARRTEQILNDFIKLLRLGTQVMRPSRLDMKAMAEEVVKELRPSASQAEFQISDIAPGWGDAGLIRQVWVNLLSNAVKFSRSRERPVIEVGSSHQPGRTDYYIRDNGSGFEMEYAHQLWRPFGRLHGAEVEGSGLGLSVVRQIIQRHDGEVRAEGRPGEGATFYFSLPDERPAVG